jgi:hypothetical protein
LTIAEEGGMEKLEKLNQEAKAKGYIVIEWQFCWRNRKSSEKYGSLLTFIPVMLVLKLLKEPIQVL